MFLHILRSIVLTLGFVLFIPLLGWLIIPYALWKKTEAEERQSSCTH